ncbi:MAG TPA: hypothetical protein VKE27_06645 [Candidatus Dormibacteraeota bacterium]|nr:hypothetical protein [Candidatus Dormibacteraeota bacterium]
MPVVDALTEDRQPVPWSLAVAGAIAFVGGLTPFVFGGASSRLTGAIVPFTIGAIGLGAAAFLHNQGRTTVAILYFLAGLAIVYGLMSMFALPLRLAALGSCPVDPQPCPSGLPRVLSVGENNGIGAAAAAGILALFVGFYGLVTIYRRQTPPPFTPPVRRIPPMPAHSTPASSSTLDSRDHPVTAALKTPDKADKPEAEELELPAPEELPELPAHESSTSNT